MAIAQVSRRSSPLNQSGFEAQRGVRSQNFSVYWLFRTNQRRHDISSDSQGNIKKTLIYLMKEGINY
ncbi:hypothetical protein JYQ62_08750 [Nostoc sp. UHCC 0702]|nr:hypothetical protein JYQ62_08750 [Nostoc sp. UHCC 0702]